MKTKDEFNSMQHEELHILSSEKILLRLTINFSHLYVKTFKMKTLYLHNKLRYLDTICGIIFVFNLGYQSFIGPSM